MSFRIHRSQSLPTPYLLPAANPSPITASTHPISSSFRDVHVYDYTYRESDYTPLVSEGQREWIDRLSAKIQNHIALQGLNLIVANIGNLNNFDTTNQKRAEDLLADIAYVILTQDTDLLPLLEEQLVDMYQLGQCAQGRVTRLWQLRQLISQ